MKPSKNSIVNTFLNFFSTWKCPFRHCRRQHEYRTLWVQLAQIEHNLLTPPLSLLFYSRERRNTPVTSPSLTVFNLKKSFPKQCSENTTYVSSWYQSTLKCGQLLIGVYTAIMIQRKIQCSPHPRHARIRNPRHEWNLNSLLEPLPLLLCLRQQESMYNKTRGISFRYLTMSGWSKFFNSSPGPHTLYFLVKYFE